MSNCCLFSRSSWSLSLTILAEFLFSSFWFSITFKNSSFLFCSNSWRLRDSCSCVQWLKGTQCTVAFLGPQAFRVFYCSLSCRFKIFNCLCNGSFPLLNDCMTTATSPWRFVCPLTAGRPHVHASTSVISLWISEFSCSTTRALSSLHKYFIVQTLSAVWFTFFCLLYALDYVCVLHVYVWIFSFICVLPFQFVLWHIFLHESCLWLSGASVCLTVLEGFFFTRLKQRHVCLKTG